MEDKTANGGKDFAKPCPFAISWTHSPVASKLGALPLRQSRHDGEFRLMKLHKRSRRFAQFFSSAGCFN